MSCRDAGFDHVSRQVSGLVLSENKTLQGIYTQQVWLAGEEGTRRAMHAGGFEAGWSNAKLMRTHHAVVAADHRGRGRKVIGVDWMQAHHERGTQNYGVKEAFDYVNQRQSLFQTVVTAVVSNRELVDGLAVEVQQLDFAEAELEYLAMTRQESYTQMKDLQKRACSGEKSERFEFADEKATVGQKVYTIAREALAGVLRFAHSLFAQGRTCD